MKRKILNNGLAFLIATLLCSTGHTTSLAFPKPNSDKCDFYLELEKTLGCATNSTDASDYLTSYGYHYCRAFLKARHTWNESLKRWSSATAQCLQERLIQISQKLEACSSMEAQAFATHPSCYKQTGFCNLSKEERSQILNVVGRSDIVKKFRKSVTQYLDVTVACSFGAQDSITQIVRWLFAPGHLRNRKMQSGE